MIIECNKHSIKGIIQINNISYYDWIKDIVDEKEFDLIYKSSKKLIDKNIIDFINIKVLLKDKNINEKYYNILIQISNCKQISYKKRFKIIEKLNSTILNIATIIDSRMLYCN